MNARALLAAMLLGGLLMQPAVARPQDRDGDARTEHRTAEEAAPDKHVTDKKRHGPAGAAHRAQTLNGGGRVLAVHPEGDGYRVKLLKDGEVRTLHVPEEE